MPVSEFRIIGRGTKGVRVMRLDEKDKVIGVAFVSADMINGDDTATADQPGEE
jgi:DNA gyrase subunit A